MTETAVGVDVDTKNKRKTGESKQPAKHPAHSRPVSRPQLGKMQAASIVARNIVPLISVLFFGQGAGVFLLLSVFNLALGISGIGVVGVAVSQRGSYTSTTHQVVSIGVTILIGLVLTAFISTLFGWFIAVFVAQLEQELFNRTLFWSVLSIVLCALPGLWRQYNDDVKSKLTQAQFKLRDQPVVVAHIVSAGLIMLLCPHAFSFGETGLIVAAIAVTALFVLRDLGPYLMSKIPRPRFLG